MGTTQVGSNPVPIVSIGDRPGVVVNRDQTNTVFIGPDASSCNRADASILAAGDSIGVDGTQEIWAVVMTAGTTVEVDYIQGATSFFQPSSINGQTLLNTTQLLYSPTEALNNLAVSLAANGGTDQFGDVFLAGITSYVNFIASGGRVVAVEMNGGLIAFLQAPTMAGPWVTIASLTADLVGGLILSATAGVTANSGLNVTNADLVMQAGRNVQLNGGVAPSARVDNNPITVTQAVSTRMTLNYTVAANTAKGGTLYRLSCWGTGVQGTTQETLSFNVTAFGVTCPNSTLAATFAAVSQAFTWEAVCMVQVTSTGAGNAVVQYHWFVLIKPSGANTATPQSAGSPTSNVANTSIAEDMFMSAFWGSNAVGCTLTCTGSSFERIGP